MCRATASTSAGSQSKSGKPCERLTAPTSAASFDMTVKIVVPTAGSREMSSGGDGGNGSQKRSNGVNGEKGEDKLVFVILSFTNHPKFKKYSSLPPLLRF